VNSLLYEFDILTDEKFIVPKIMYLCIIRFVDNTRVAHGEGELQQEDQAPISNISKCVGEEMEIDS
jgi:hypothetical protein